jgi:spore coat protein U-like protein
MANGANLLNYAVYTDSARSTVWGDGGAGATATIDGTGSGTAQSTTIYGRIPAGQTVPAGSYSDTVNVTVTY